MFVIIYLVVFEHAYTPCMMTIAIRFCLPTQLHRAPSKRQKRSLNSPQNTIHSNFKTNSNDKILLFFIAQHNVIAEVIVVRCSMVIRKWNRTFIKHLRCYLEMLPFNKIALDAPKLPYLAMHFSWQHHNCEFYEWVLLKEESSQNCFPKVKFASPSWSKRNRWLSSKLELPIIMKYR